MANKQGSVRTPGAAAAASGHEALRIAYEIHTLAQIVYAKLAAEPFKVAAIPSLRH